MSSCDPWCVSVHVDRARLCVQLCDWVCYHLGGDQETREISSTIRFLKAFERKWAVLCWTDNRTVSLEAVWSVIELNLSVFVRRYNGASGCEYNDVNGEVPRNTPVENKHVKPVPVSHVCFIFWLKKNWLVLYQTFTNAFMSVYHQAKDSGSRLASEEKVSTPHGCSGLYTVDGFKN